MRILVDTNVFLDLILQRDTYAKIALDFFDWCKVNKNKIYITSMSFRDIEYIVRKHTKDGAKTKRILSKIYSICSKVIPISADAAINSIYEDYKDFEDGLLIEAANENLLDAIVTNNAKDFAKSKIPVFTPSQLLKVTNSSLK